MVDKVRGITCYSYVLKNSAEFVLMKVIYMAFELFKSHCRTEEREGLFRYIIEHNAITVYDNTLHYMYVSRRYLKDYRVEIQDVIGKHHYEVFPEIPPKWRDMHQRALMGEVLSGDNDVFERLDGSVDYTRWECRPWYNSDSSVGGIMIYFEVLNTMESREGPYRELFEKVPVGILLTSSSGRALKANWKMADIVEASSPEEAVAYFSDLESGLYVDTERRRELLKSLEETGKVDDFELQIKTVKGNLRWLSINARAREALPDGSCLIDGSAQNITSVKEAEK